MPKYILATGRLSLTSFKLYRRSGGNWYSANNLYQNQRYRLRLRLYNDYKNMVSPPPKNFFRIRIEIMRHPWLRWYKTSSYSGTGSTKRYVSDIQVFRELCPEKAMIHYIYFKWKGPNGLSVQHFNMKMAIHCWESIAVPHVSAAPLVLNVR